jgi:hypothetical protein
MSRDQNAGQNRNTQRSNISVEIVEQFKYLGKPLINQNPIYEEIKCSFKLGNAYYSVQNLLSSSLISKSVKIQIYRTKILPVVFAWLWNSVAYIEGGIRSKVLDNQVLRRIFGPKRDEVTGECRRLHKKELCALYSSSQEDWDGRDMWHMWGRVEVHTGF